VSSEDYHRVLATPIHHGQLCRPRTLRFRTDHLVDCPSCRFTPFCRTQNPAALLFPTSGRVAGQRGQKKPGCSLVPLSSSRIHQPEPRAELHENCLGNLSTKCTRPHVMASMFAKLAMMGYDPEDEEEERIERRKADEEAKAAKAKASEKKSVKKAVQDDLRSAAFGGSKKKGSKAAGTAAAAPSAPASEPTAAGHVDGAVGRVAEERARKALQEKEQAAYEAHMAAALRESMISAVVSTAIGGGKAGGSSKGAKKGKAASAKGEHHSPVLGGIVAPSVAPGAGSGAASGVVLTEEAERELSRRVAAELRIAKFRDEIAAERRDVKAHAAAVAAAEEGRAAAAAAAAPASPASSAAARVGSRLMSPPPGLSGATPGPRLIAAGPVALPSLAEAAVMSREQLLAGACVLVAGLRDVCCRRRLVVQGRRVCRSALAVAAGRRRSFVLTPWPLMLCAPLGATAMGMQRSSARLQRCRECRGREGLCPPTSSPSSHTPSNHVSPLPSVHSRPSRVQRTSSSLSRWLRRGPRPPRRSERRQRRVRRYPNQPRRRRPPCWRSCGS